MKDYTALNFILANNEKAYIQEKYPEDSKHPNYYTMKYLNSPSWGEFKSLPAHQDLSRPISARLFPFTDMRTPSLTGIVAFLTKDGVFFYCFSFGVEE